MSYIHLNKISKTYGNMKQPAIEQIQLDINKGEIITLLGPSGCGKTTTLRMIAGLEEPSGGEIHIGGEPVHTSSFTIPPEKRGIGMVFQDYALFPHLTVEKNILFGLNKWPRKEKKKRVLEVLELVGLSEYSKRYPYELSGGQQQRVALARALAPRPKLILLDEPFSNLDIKMREKMRKELNDILRQAQTTTILVTHDQKDAFAVSDRVVVMNRGRIQQIADPKTLYRCPKNCFVAEFLGKTNLLTGKLDNDLKHVFTGIGKVCLPEHSKEKLDQVTVSIRPEGCRIKEDGAFCGEVENITYYGEYQEVTVRLNSQTAGSGPTMIIYVQMDHDLQAGDRVSFDIIPHLVSLIEESA